MQSPLLHPPGYFIHPHSPQDIELENMRDVTGDDSQQPLIAEDQDGNENNTSARPEVTKQEANRLIWLLTLSAGLSGLLFGYE